MSSTTIDSELYTKKGTLRKRKPKKDRNYFTQDTENAILEYLAETDSVKREIIFSTRINYAFNKLIENIIHTFKFYYTDNVSVAELKHEIVVLLMEVLNKFNASKGKAYSYFGTIVKNYLIAYNTKNYSNLKNKGELLEADHDKTIVNDLINNEYKNDLSDFIDYFVSYVDNNIDYHFTKSIDKETAAAVIELFRTRKDIDIFNKKAIYIYIRELVDVETSQITKINNKLNSIYSELYNDYCLLGYVDIYNPLKI